MAFTLRWWPRHLAMLIIVTAFSLLGRWQWDVSASARGGLQNLLYAFQWWVMAGIVIYGWWRLLHDDVHGRPAPKLAPVSATDDATWAGTAWAGRALTTSDLMDAQLANEEPDETDEELARYNEYLASLHRRAENAR